MIDPSSSESIKHLLVAGNALHNNQQKLPSVANPNCGIALHMFNLLHSILNSERSTIARNPKNIDDSMRSHTHVIVQLIGRSVGQSVRQLVSLNSNGRYSVA